MADFDLKKMRKFMKRIGFHCVKEVGRGGFGTVYEAIKVRGTKKGHAYAVKKLRSSKEKSIERELIVQERLSSSKFIPKYHFKYCTDEDTYLFFDFIKGGNLLDHLEDNGDMMHEDDVKPYLERIILGIEELHKNLIIHRDIKLENIVLDEDGSTYIIDFGCAKIFNKDEIAETEGKTGTITYNSPEMLRGLKYSYDTDWWSFGVCVFEMIAGELPFADHEDSDEVVKNKILQEEICWKKLNYVTEDAKDFLKKLLSKNPNQRLGRYGAREILNHPFMTS